MISGARSGRRPGFGLIGNWSRVDAIGKKSDAKSKRERWRRKKRLYAEQLAITFKARNKCLGTRVRLETGTVSQKYLRKKRRISEHAAAEPDTNTTQEERGTEEKKPPMVRRHLSVWPGTPFPLDTLGTCPGSRDRENFPPTILRSLFRDEFRLVLSRQSRKSFRLFPFYRY